MIVFETTPALSKASEAAPLLTDDGAVDGTEVGLVGLHPTNAAANRRTAGSEERRAMGASIGLRRQLREGHG